MYWFLSNLLQVPKNTKNLNTGHIYKTKSYFYHLYLCLNASRRYLCQVSCAISSHLPCLFGCTTRCGFIISQAPILFMYFVKFSSVIIGCLSIINVDNMLTLSDLLSSVLLQPISMLLQFNSLESTNSILVFFFQASACFFTS